jgi:hypothetical protein
VLGREFFRHCGGDDSGCIAELRLKICRGRSARVGLGPTIALRQLRLVPKGRETSREYIMAHDRQRVGEWRWPESSAVSPRACLVQTIALCSRIHNMYTTSTRTTAVAAGSLIILLLLFLSWHSSSLPPLYSSSESARGHGVLQDASNQTLGVSPVHGI